MPLSTQTKSPLELVTYTALLSIGAVAGNYLSIPLMFGVDFIFGSIFTVYALLTLGLLPAIVAALAGGIYTLALWGHPYALIIFVAEAIVLGIMIKRNYKNTVILDLVYWCSLGMPLVMLFYVGIMGMETLSAGMIALKQTLNGVFNVLCAHLLLLLQFSLRKKQAGFDLNFEQLIFYPLLSIILLIGGGPLIWDGLVLRSNLEKQLSSRLHDQLIAQSNTPATTATQIIPLTGLGDVTLYKFSHNQSQNFQIPSLHNYQPQTSSHNNLSIYLHKANMSAMQRWHQGIYYYQLKSPSTQQTLIATMPSASIIDVIEKERTLEFSLLSLLLLLGLASAKIMSKWLAKPLRSMMMLSYNIEQKVGTGEVIDYPCSNIREYQRLSDSLQRMSSNLSSNLKQKQQSNQDLESQVQERSEELSLVIDSTGVGIWDWYVQTGEVKFNERWAEIIGYTLDELAPTTIDTWMKFCHPDDLEESGKKLEQHWQGKQARYVFEARMKHKQGHWVWVLDSGQTVEFDADGNPIRMVGTHLDVTARKLAEAEMEKLSKIASQTSNAVIITNVAGEIDWVNDSFTRITGYPSSDVMGRTPGSFLQGRNTDPDTVDRIRKALARQKSFHEEIINYHRNGKPYWVEIHCNPLKNKGGHVTGFMAIETDISKQKETAQALQLEKERAEAASKVKGEFLASMSHEIRTPMNGVMGMLNLLMRDELTQEQLRRAKLASSSAHALLNLINDILDFSKVDAGKLELESLEFNLLDELGDLAESMAIRAQEKDIELILDTVKVEHACACSDPSRLRQILTNIIGNAIKFTSAGEVTIRCSLKQTSPEELVFYASVTDTGIGIPEDKIASLFDSFTQVDASTTRQYGGTGLGLAIAKRLCELMDGSIAVSSREGEGSCFDIVLCFKTSADLNSETPQLIPKAANILIIDDNPKSAEALQRQFQRWQINTSIATDAEQALQLCELSNEVNTDSGNGEKFDVILIDRKMPNIDGLELGGKIHALEKYNHTPMVLMKQMADDIASTTLIDHGFNAALPKPIINADLLDIINLLNNQEDTSLLLTREPTPAAKTSKPSSEIGDKKIRFNWPQSSRILLVEDNAINRAVALGMLADLGLCADIAEDGLQAVQALQQTEPQEAYSLVLMDCQMPVMDGYECTRKIRQGECGQHNRDIAIVAMTANAMKGDQAKCLAAGMNDYLSKPIDVSTLEKSLLRWLDGTLVCDLQRETLAATSTSLAGNDSSADNNHSVWNQAALLSRVSNRPERAAKLITMFLDSLPERMAVIDKARRENNLSELQSIAHIINGTCANLGAEQCHHLAKALEQQIKSKQAPISDQVDELKTALRQVSEVLKNYLQGLE